jgi:hypothetical protein
MLWCKGTGKEKQQQRKPKPRGRTNRSLSCLLSSYHSYSTRDKDRQMHKPEQACIRGTYILCKKKDLFINTLTCLQRTDLYLFSFYFK